MTASYDFHTLDVFTDTMFGGNPLAVVTDARGLTTGQMVQITREFNLSETVFVFPPENPEHTRRVRIFTPGRELPFAGHPTVGTAFLLAATGMIPLVEGDTHIVLEEGVGPVRVTVRVRDGKPVSAQLTTAQPPEYRDSVRSANEIAELLSVAESDVTGSGMQIRMVSCGVPFLLVPLVSQDAVSRARLDRSRWEGTIAHDWAREVYVFDAGAASSGDPIRARMFAPDLGVGEDPATGSAAACLAVYLANRLRERATYQWTIHQGVEMGRPSVIEISAGWTQAGIENVRVAGRAVLVSEGKLRVEQATTITT